MEPFHGHLVTSVTLMARVSSWRSLGSRIPKRLENCGKCSSIPTVNLTQYYGGTTKHANAEDIVTVTSTTLDKFLTSPSLGFPHL